MNMCTFYSIYRRKIKVKIRHIKKIVIFFALPSKI